MRNYFVLDANLFHAYSAKVSARGYKLNRNVSVTKKTCLYVEQLSPEFDNGVTLLDPFLDEV